MEMTHKDRNKGNQVKRRISRPGHVKERKSGSKSEGERGKQEGGRVKEETGGTEEEKKV